MRYKNVAKVLISEEEIIKRTNVLAKQITEDYKGEKLLLVCILRGASLFFADLVRKIDLDVNFDFMAVSSYGAGTSSSGEVRIIKDICEPVEGKNVILVEDIIDSGNTLQYLVRLLKQRNPKSIKIAALLDKPERREVSIQGDYIGFTIPNEFVVGYGLDYNEKYRNIPEVCVLKSEIYES
ncbi:MAG: hypoxanthine phosphoribosyltransferase [Bacillota bacterium]|jgi:hypoxanthine phosphoribosyltransferase|nr:hypoxanthine phosphoribosyltransferase [Bacillota bacterium]HHU43373.1 hypoxanthine phosphoribosyltransferase [Clostridiales bacterium]